MHGHELHQLHALWKKSLVLRPFPPSSIQVSISWMWERSWNEAIVSPTSSSSTITFASCGQAGNWYPEMPEVHAHVICRIRVCVRADIAPTWLVCIQILPGINCLETVMGQPVLPVVSGSHDGNGGGSAWGMEVGSLVVGRVVVGWWWGGVVVVWGSMVASFPGLQHASPFWITCNVKTKGEGQ